MTEKVLQRLNVVKRVSDETQIKRMLAEGYEEVKPKSKATVKKNEEK